MSRPKNESPRVLESAVSAARLTQIVRLGRELDSRSTELLTVIRAYGPALPHRGDLADAVRGSRDLLDQIITALDADPAAPVGDPDGRFALLEID